MLPSLLHKVQGDDVDVETMAMVTVTTTVTGGGGGKTHPWLAGSKVNFGRLPVVHLVASDEPE